ncbi:MAG: sodium-dependent bicarbonate transport family permease [Chloroherpetonaceae bacterium]|nr:sodium-dependent bicarbonate transport family permease [Chloroherpetonaceae bacterium]MCS7211820.1 sodium-dependent bicarbonate transport family permease [Chloroherpetonaceae bacterium]MDW8018601.1 sodium-dependent bicarbonate transport family permease [Chloroherpetonaceae bacterium]MDW8467296.1 sodium-dependent bicarbonate transport family permease [Chloroherpetonaceae bacterium]
MGIQDFTVSLLSPMVLAFVLGIIATLIKSDLKFPEELYIALTIYLLVAIGLKGGYKLSTTPFGEFWKPGVVAIAICILIPIWSYWILHRFGKFDIANAAAVAAHYGSVSAVTFAEAVAFHDNLKAALLEENPALTETALRAMGATYEGFMPSLLTIMEVPGILVALFIARTSKVSLALANGGLYEEENSRAGAVLRELLAGKSTLLLVGCLVIGALAGKRGWEQVSPFFDTPFRGILTLFLLEAGLVTGRRLADLKKVGGFLIGFGLIMPVLHAILGIVLGKLAGLSMGGATILGVLSASASYIAAPAAVRVALPEASPTYFLTASLAITFPFNIIVGLPLYHSIAKLIYGA